MGLYAVLPAIAAAGFLLAMALIALRPEAPAARASWMVPAVLCLMFAAWSGYAVATEGPAGFWPVHTANAWGNQVWFDLLLAAGVASFCLAPGAKQAGMRVRLWLLLVVMTGSIGLLAMLSRYLYLREKGTVT